MVFPADFTQNIQEYIYPNMSIEEIEKGLSEIDSTFKPQCMNLGIVPTEELAKWYESQENWLLKGGPKPSLTRPKTQYKIRIFVKDLSLADSKRNFNGLEIDVEELNPPK